MLKRVLLWCAVAFALFYAVQGGEYSTADLFRQRNRTQRLQRAIDSVEHVVDSLRALKRRVQTDPVLQERIARESYGMVRSEKELIYRFVDPDSVTRRARPDTARIP